MGKYIDVDQLFQCETCFHHQGGKCDAWCDHGEAYRPAMSKLKIVDAVEVKHGEWVDKRWTTECDWCDMNHHSIICSVCKEETYGGIKTKYCPDCGAKMDGKKGE
jgi:hypothetical protein